MHKLSSIVFLFIILITKLSCVQNQNRNKKDDLENKFGIVIHGGAGTILKKNMSDEKEQQYKAKLKEAIQVGYEILKNNGTSIDAVEKSIIVLENSPLFNAGKGSVFSNRKKNEMDASIMCGKTLNAGAVSGVTNVKNPISLALAVMNQSEHVMLSNKGAESFAKVQGLKIVDSTYFFTESRYRSLLNTVKTEKYGTVGAVALDKFGNLSSGTSTGGMTNKKWGRIGDSPIIGAGTYANNKTCAISSTGWGEFFIRGVIAYDISAMMEYQNLRLLLISHHPNRLLLKAKEIFHYSKNIHSRETY